MCLLELRQKMPETKGLRLSCQAENCGRSKFELVEFLIKIDLPAAPQGPTAAFDAAAKKKKEEEHKKSEVSSSKPRTSRTLQFYLLQSVGRRLISLFSTHQALNRNKSPSSRRCNTMIRRHTCSLLGCMRIHHLCGEDKNKRCYC